MKADEGGMQALLPDLGVKDAFLSSNPLLLKRETLGPGYLGSDDDVICVMYSPRGIVLEMVLVVGPHVL